MTRRDDDKLILVVKQVFRASAEFLFDAWTDPKLMAQWFHAQPNWTTEVTKSDFRVGGAWEIVMHADQGPDCRSFGKYIAIERPRRLVFTWHANAEQDYETVVTLTLRAIDPHTTELVLLQTGLRNEQDRSEHQHGWEGCLTSLERLAETQTRVEKGRT
jgi:uncharacterized protein YndB with AHSA1/START domain